MRITRRALVAPPASSNSAERNGKSNVEMNVDDDEEDDRTVVVAPLYSAISSGAGPMERRFQPALRSINDQNILTVFSDVAIQKAAIENTLFYTATTPSMSTSIATAESLFGLHRQNDRSSSTERPQLKRNLSLVEMLTSDQLPETTTFVPLDENDNAVSMLLSDFGQSSLGGPGLLKTASSTSTILQVDDTLPRKSVSSHRTVSVPNLLIQWNLHSMIRIISSSSLEWCFYVSRKERGEALASYNSNATTIVDEAFRNNQAFGSATTRTQFNHSVKFQQSLLYYTYPANRLDYQSISTDSATKPDSSLANDSFHPLLVAQRSLRWEEAFTSAYFCLRNDQLHHFYIVSNNMVTLFLSSLANDKEVVAVIPKLPNGLLQLFDRLEILYETFTSSQLKSAESDMSVNAKDVNTRIHTINKREKKAAPEETKAIIVRGRPNVHRLYLWFLNDQKRAESDPFIVSPNSFLHSTMQSLKVTQRARTLRTPFNLKDKQEAQYDDVLEITGCILPTCLFGILQALSSNQPFSTFFFPEHGMHSINLIPNVTALQSPDDKAGWSYVGDLYRSKQIPVTSKLISMDYTEDKYSYNFT